MDAFVRISIAICCGALLGTSTFIAFLWPLAPMTIAFFLYLIFSSSRTHSLLIGSSFGAGLMGAVLIWAFDALPLSWLGISNPLVSFSLIFSIWIFYSLILAVPFAIFSRLMRMHHEGSWWLLCTAPVVWVLNEFLRAFLHVLTTWGAGSALSFDSTFGFVGYSLSSSGYLRVAPLGGIILLSVLVIEMGVILYVLYRQGKRSSSIRACAYSLTFFGIICGVGYGIPSPVATVFTPGVVIVEGVRIVPLSTNFEASLSRTTEQYRENESQVASIILHAISQDPDVIVLPEYSRYLKGESLLSEDLQKSVRSKLAENNILLIDSERTTDGNFGAIIFFDAKTPEMPVMHMKRFLPPFGEYLPHPFLMIFRAFGFDRQVDAILKNRTYYPSRDPYFTRTFTWHNITFGVLACSEIFSPFGYRAVSNAGADALINIASHSWLRGGEILFKETLAMARVHVAYTGKPYIQATNYGPALVVYPVEYPLSFENVK